MFLPLLLFWMFFSLLLAHLVDREFFYLYLKLKQALHLYVLMIIIFSTYTFYLNAFDIYQLYHIISLRSLKELI